MKMLKSAIFFKKSLKINMLKIKNFSLKIFIFIFRNHCNYTGEYRGAAHNICNLEYNIPK